MEPQLRGVVIITLPPPGDPSKGKTITAFAIPDDSGDLLPPPTAADDQQQQQQRYQVDAPAASWSSSPTSGRGFSTKRAATSVLGASLVVFALWAYLFSEAPFEFLQSSEELDRERDEGSLLFPLYPKPGGPRFLHQKGEVKLGSAAGHGRGRAMEKQVESIKATASPLVNSSAAFPVRGNIFPDGLYYTSIHVGDPPKQYFLDVDTGSDLTWIQCDAPCQSCAKGPNPLYKPTKSKIVSPMDSLCLEVQTNQKSRPCDSCQQCDYEIAYADQSSSMGVLARDELQLIMVNRKKVTPSFVFGCAYDQQGQLLASPAKTDGILGLSNAKVSLPSQLSDQTIITNVVGHCIRVNGGGYMFLGGDFVPRWRMSWVPMLDAETSYYQTEVAKISYGNQPLGARNKRSNLGNVVFDTGSSYTYFTNEAYTDLITSLKDIYPALAQDESDKTLPLCWRANFPVRSVKDVGQFFHPLTLHFGKKWWVVPRNFQIPPEGYLIVNNEGNVCLGILNGTEVHDGSTNILGDISLRGQLVVYDNVERQIGWVQSDCAKPQRSLGLPL